MSTNLSIGKELIRLVRRSVDRKGPQPDGAVIGRSGESFHLDWGAGAFNGIPSSEVSLVVTRGNRLGVTGYRAAAYGPAVIEVGEATTDCSQIGDVPTVEAEMDW